MARSHTIGRLFALTLLGNIAVTGCGGSGNSVSATPKIAPASTSVAAQGGLAPVTLTIGRGTASNTTRRAQYVSTATQSATVSIQGPAGSKTSTTTLACAGGCSASIQAPVGQDIFTVTLYDQSNGAGNALSTGRSVTNVTSINNVVSMVMQGVIAAVSVSAVQPSLAVGQAAGVPLTVAALDAGNHTIIGSYDRPISLNVTDASSATTVAPQTVSDSATSVTLNYSGDSTFSQATVTATSSGLDPSKVGTAAIAAAATSRSPYVPAGTVSRKHAAYPFFGALAHFQFGDPSLEQVELSHDAAVGVNLIRYEVAGSVIERTPGVFDFSAVDAQIDPIIARGMGVLPIAIQYNAPAWANGNKVNNWQPIWQDPAAYGAFAGAIAAHFSQKYHANRIEIGNEINLAPMYWLTTDSRYIDSGGKGQAPYLIAAYNAVHSGAPGVTVWPCISTSGVSPATFVDTITQAGAGYHKGFDGFAIHNYFWYDPTTVAGVGNSWPAVSVFSSWNYYENQMRADGDPTPHIMVTEWGWSSQNPTPLSETTRAQWIATGLSMMMNDPNIDAQTYTGIDDQQGGFWGGFTLFDSNGAMLPGAVAYKALATY